MHAYICALEGVPERRERVNESCRTDQVMRKKENLHLICLLQLVDSSTSHRPFLSSHQPIPPIPCQNVNAP